jgi:hypothetical protein
MFYFGSSLVIAIDFAVIVSRFCSYIIVQF